MSQPTQTVTARLPVAVQIAATESPVVDTVLLRLKDIARDVAYVSLSRSGPNVLDTVFERVLSSWTRMTRLQLAGLRRPSIGDGMVLEHLAVLHYRHELMFSNSYDLFRILHSMPNLQELKLVSVVGELQDAVTPPPCRLRTYSYHTKLPPSSQWHHPILNSRGSLRELSLILSVAPPVESILSAAEIIGPSLEILFLRGTTHLISMAEVLVPQSVRLRELKIHVLVSETNVDSVVGLVTSGPRAPLRRLYVTMPPVLVDILGRTLEEGVPPPLRTLRELRPLPSVDRDINVSHVARLVRVCAQRKIRFDPRPLLPE